jgi:hypothetical protein
VRSASWLALRHDAPVGKYSELAAWNMNLSQLIEIQRTYLGYISLSCYISRWNRLN